MSQQPQNRALETFFPQTEFPDHFVEVANDGNSAEINYDDGYDREEIGLYKTINEYGVAIYNLSIDTASKDDNEMQKPDVLSQHEMGDDITPSKAKRMDTKNANLEKKWLAKKSITADDITYSTSIMTEDCHVQMSHVHEYFAVKLTVETSDVEKLQRIITARNELLALYRASI